LTVYLKVCITKMPVAINIIITQVIKPIAIP
jgi:hypothetical protein